MGEWGESNIQLISAKAEAELGLSLETISPTMTPPLHPDISNQLLHSKCREFPAILLLFRMSRITRPFNEKIMVNKSFIFQ